MNHSPAWSPDGKWMFQEVADSIQLTTHLSRNMSPAWVPEPFFSVSPSAEKMTTLWGRLKQY